MITITLELTPEEAATLTEQAQARGVDVQTVVHDLIDRATREQQEQKPPLTEKQKAAIALIDEWRAEDAAADREEMARRDAELEEFKANINRWRGEEGRRPAYR